MTRTRTTIEAFFRGARLLTGSILFLASGLLAGVFVLAGVLSFVYAPSVEAAAHSLKMFGAALLTVGVPYALIRLGRRDG